MKITIPMIGRNDILCAPPYGNLGVLILNKNPEAKVGESVEIECIGSIMIRGVITAIENPGSSIRPDTPIDKFKIHWVPYDPHVITEALYRRLTTERKRLATHKKSKTGLVPSNKSGNGSRDLTRGSSSNDRTRRARDRRSKS